jgi:hypothetical protein
MSEDTATAVVTDPAQAQGAPGSEVQPALSVAPASAQDWAAHIPKELAGEKVWERYKGKALPEILGQVVELSKYNAGAIRLPGEQDKPEERAKKLDDVYSKLGRPAQPTEYKVTAQMPEGFQLSEQHDAAFKQVAHKLGMNNDQLNAIYGFYGQYLAEGAKAQEQARKESLDKGLTDLKDKWGSKFDENRSLAQRGFAKFAEQVLGSDAEAQGLMDALAETGMGNDPRMVQVAARLGGMMAEAKLIQGDSAGDSTGDVQAKIDQLKADPAYWNDAAPNHAALVQKVADLYKEKNNPIYARA